MALERWITEQNARRDLTVSARDPQDSTRTAQRLVIELKTQRPASVLGQLRQMQSYLDELESGLIRHIDRTVTPIREQLAAAIHQLEASQLTLFDDDDYPEPPPPLSDLVDSEEPRYSDVADPEPQPGD